MEWIIYNDIFVEGDYDVPISDVLNSTNQSLNIVDLGANVGFFDLRVAHLTRLNRSSKEVNIIAVEASKKLCEELTNRWITPEMPSSVKLEVIHGLVGSKSGSGQLFQFDDHGLNSAFRKNGKSISVNYINLSKACSNFHTIDLLKCDIEGSELNFIANNEDILSKTNALVIEFHPEFCDIASCKNQLKQSGFSQSQLIKDYGNCAVHYFKRT